MWSIAVNKFLDNTALNKRDEIIILSFGKSLGTMNMDMQKRNIDLTINYIDKEIESLDNKIHKNGNLYKSLGVLSGLLIAVLLI